MSGTVGNVVPLIVERTSVTNGILEQVAGERRTTPVGGSNGLVHGR